MGQAGRSTIRTRRSLALTAVLVLGLGVAACGDDDDDDASSDTTASEDEGGGSGDGAELLVEANEYSDVSASAGGQLDVVNTSGAPHTFTADDGAFDAEVPDGDTVTVDVPAEAGDYGFHCEIHPSMQATLTVE